MDIAARDELFNDPRPMANLVLPYQMRDGYLLPLCDIFLIGRNQRARQRVLIDSGAVVSIFAERAAEDAGIALPPSRNFAVHYGSEKVWGRRVRVAFELQARRFDVDAVFVERLILPYGLLGRRGVFAGVNEVAFLERSAPQRVELRG